MANGLLSVFAGVSAFILTLLGFLLLGRLDQQIVASLFIGLFALLLVRVATERPNSSHARAVAALIDRLLAVARGDLSSPAPPLVRKELPALASAVDGLFDQVRTSLDNFHALAMYDPVTTLPNRLHFRKEAERILAGRALDQQPALLFIDLDGFKEVNDRLGHAQGDQVLIMVANRLREVVRAESQAGSLNQPLLARLAGDEFTLLLPDSGREEAERIASQVLEALTEPFRSPCQTSHMGASIGVALCPAHGDDLTSLMKAADIAMYHAKESGRARACLYDPELARVSMERAALQGELGEAIAAGALELVYRPQLCLRSGAILAGEALVQWNRPGGPLLLDRLPAMVQDAALAQALGEWTLDAAVKACARWRAAGLDQPLSVRLPDCDIGRFDLAARLTSAFDGWGGDPWPLELELVQGQIAALSVGAHLQLAMLRESGVGIAIGGFGGGKANLPALVGFAADKVKLDPALLIDIDTSDRARIVAASLVQMVRALGSTTVAGPVERQEQLEVLRAIGCDAVQGFLRVEPLDEATFIAWVAGQDCAGSLARVS
ncbi:putative bifunctional diguanylate cyclase/phosphodiesterase [Sphingomonas parva]|uniref:putative bifunctional diguanylate cyclase/phosphodiesterase n=1 Tax=Sphingomonas parva TaxID=2555898 RepID=UPI001430472A|nr:EAL domain-containing protein [Sphingomonas parva]